MNLSPGYILKDAYRIDAVLGQGGFGITYLATDLSLDRKVAIKEFFPKEYCDRDASTSHVTMGTAGSKALVERLKAKFLKEARTIARFECPYIIKIHAAFEANNTAYYVMEYIEGDNLRDIVRARGPLSQPRAVNYISKVGEALEYIHRQHINHLDVKPANIMIRRDGDTPVLIDFGLSKQYDADGNQTSTTPTGLSHGYAPIEQYRPGGVSNFAPQSDIYSLAATLYYLLTGVVPPQAIDLVSQPLSFSSSFPASLKRPINKAMSVQRESRHETVSQFISQISPLNDYEATVDKDRTRVVSTVPPTQRPVFFDQPPRPRIKKNLELSLKKNSEVKLGSDFVKKKKTKLPSALIFIGLFFMVFWPLFFWRSGEYYKLFGLTLLNNDLKVYPQDWIILVYSFLGVGAIMVICGLFLRRRYSRINRY